MHSHETYNGYTLYRYEGDTGGGQVHGQALESEWFTLGSNGSLVKIDPSSSATGNSSSSGSSAGGSSGGGSSSSGSSGSTSGGYGDY